MNTHSHLNRKGSTTYLTTFCFYANVTQYPKGASNQAPLTKAKEAANEAQETILKREYDGASADAL